MIGKVQLDSFQGGLGIRTGDFADFGYEPASAGSPQSHLFPGESFLLSDCPVVVGSGRPSSASSMKTGSSSQEPCNSSRSPLRPLTPLQQQPQSPNNNNSNSSTTNASRYKTEMCRPFQEHGVCKYGEKCQFAHGESELRIIQRHPKYKTDMCRTYHSVGFCPYGPRCHFIHSLDEMRAAQNASQNSPDGKRSGAGANGGLKQLPMFGGNTGNGSSNGMSSSNNTWNSFPAKQDSSNFGFGFNSRNGGMASGDSFGSSASMKSAVAQLNNYFNMDAEGEERAIGSGRLLLGSSTASRSGSFSSDGESSASYSPSSSSPPPDSLCTSPIDVSRSLRLPIFNRLA